MGLRAGGKGQVEGGKTICRSARSTFHLPPNPAQSASADGVREVGDYPEGLVRDGGARFV